MVNLAITSHFVFHLACGFTDRRADLNHASCSSLSLLVKVRTVHTEMCTCNFCAHDSVNLDLFVLNYRKICKVLQIAMLICMLLS